MKKEKKFDSPQQIHFRDSFENSLSRIWINIWINRFSFRSSSPHTHTHTLPPLLPYPILSTKLVFQAQIYRSLKMSLNRIIAVALVFLPQIFLTHFFPFLILLCLLHAPLMTLLFIYQTNFSRLCIVRHVPVRFQIHILLLLNRM